MRRKSSPMAICFAFQRRTVIEAMSSVFKVKKVKAAA
jgi:hypothetical protein